MMTDAVVCTPLVVEQIALRGARSSLRITRTGKGPARSAKSARQLAREPRAVLVAGVAGALQSGVRTGDLVVASEIRVDGGRVTSLSAPLLAGALRRAGLRAHLGPILSSGRVVPARAVGALAATGALAVDMESGQLSSAAGDEPFAVLRAIVDTPDAPLLRPGTVPRGIRALRSLRSAAPVIEQWGAAIGDREIVLASPRSFCAGVGRAIEIVERSLQRHGAPVYVRRQIVHNAHVVRDLESRGAIFVDEVDEVPAGSVVVFAAHGVSPEVRIEAQLRGLSVIDATCPLVTKVHTEVRRYAARGDTVFLIGHRDHEEVIGTVGEAPGDVVVVADADDAASVRARDPDRVAYVMQTTLAVDEAREVADVLRERFPALSAPRRDDICYATTNRQLAIRRVAAESELVLVLGSANSSNSRRLVEVAEREGAPAHLVDDATDVDLRWLAGVSTIGITAGASAPAHLVDELVRCLSGLGTVTLRNTHIVDETVQFTLPREVI
jgi:4-hydroxy-3-methylbut-2-enyl diphosphate reductase